MHEEIWEELSELVAKRRQQERRIAMLEAEHEEMARAIAELQALVAQATVQQAA